MTMTEYLPIDPFGLDTIEVEAFGSLFCRMARIHSVSIYTLAMHLRHWWKMVRPEDDRAKQNVINATNPMLCGYGDNVDAYLEIVRAATGCETLQRTTLLALKRALDPKEHGVVRADRAWCPACLEESILSDTPFYDRLVWALPYMQRCPIHKIRLQTACPACGAIQLHYHHLGSMELCCKCKLSLHGPADTWEVVDQVQLYERECLDIVLRVARGHLKVAPNAYSVFIRSFSEYLSPLNKKISKFTYRAARRPQLAREERPPRLETLLRRCAAFGVNPADVLVDPVDVARSACLLEFARLDLPSSAKPRRPDEIFQLAKKRLEGEIDETRLDSIPSLRQIAREIGVSTGYLNFHFPELIPRYSALRLTNAKKSLQRARENGLRYLLDGPIKTFPSAEFPSQDHLVAATVSNTGISVSQARKAVSVALKERFGWRAYEKYRKRRRRDPTVKWPPCDW